MGVDKEMKELARRCIALEEARLKWTVKETHAGWHVMAPPVPDSPVRPGTTIPYRNHGRALPNTLSKLRGMGLERDEAKLQSVAAPARGQQASPRPLTPVPVAQFTPAAMPDRQEEAVPDTSQPQGAATEQRDPIPYEEIQAQIKDFFEVPMPIRPHGRPRYYKRIQGLLMKDGTKRYLCADNKSCNLTYANPYMARRHLGYAHPSELAQKRRAAEAADRRDGAAQRIVASPNGATAPTPAVMPRKMAPELVRPVIPPATKPLPIERPSAAAPSSQPPSVDSLVAGLSSLIDGYSRYRKLAEDGEGQWRARIEAAEQRAAEAEQRAKAEKARADEALAKLDVIRRASAA